MLEFMIFCIVAVVFYHVALVPFLGATSIGIATHSIKQDKIKREKFVSTILGNDKAEIRKIALIFAAEEIKPEEVRKFSSETIDQMIREICVFGDTSYFESELLKARREVRIRNIA